MAGSQASRTGQSVATSPASSPSLFRIYSLVGIMVLIWSLNFIVAKEALREIPPLVLAFLRTALAAAFMLPLHLASARRGWAAKDLPVLALVATTGITVNQIFYALALRYTSVGHGSVIMATTPLVVLLIVVLSRQERGSWSKVGGMIVAFGGVAWLQMSHAEAGSASLLGDMSALTCASSFAISTVLGKNVMDRYGAISVTTFSNVLGTVCLLPVAFFPRFDFSAVSSAAWWGVVYMGALAGAAGTFIYFYALAYLPSSRLSMYAYIQPILATLAAFLILSEPVTATMLVAGALVLAGVWISGLRA